MTDREKNGPPAVFRAVFMLLALCGLLYAGYHLVSDRSNKSAVGAAKNVGDSRKQSDFKAVGTTGVGAVVGGDPVGSNVTAGRKLFGDLCVACHGEDAKGKVGPDLTVSTYKYGKTRLVITKTITEGRPGGMPSFSSQIGKEQIESLVDFVLSLK